VSRIDTDRILMIRSRVMKTLFVAVLASVALTAAGCSVLKKLNLSSADATVASDLVTCVQKAVDAVKDKALTHDEKVDVASKAAGECAKPVVDRFLPDKS
jgi:hypothetical protein